jgi:hypothetical protein
VNCYEVFLGNAGGSERKASSSMSLEWDGMGLADREAAEADMGTAENLVDDDVGNCVSDGT